MDVTAIAASGMQTAMRQFTANAAQVVSAGVTPAGNLPSEITGMLQAQSDFRANLAVLRAGESMNKQLLDILT